MAGLIDLDALEKMLYGDKAYIKEFSEAALISFSEFNEHYKKYLLARDEEKFRKAGHKIKPVAQMLGLNQIIEEYEHAKTLLWDEKPGSELESSADNMDKICTEVLTELESIASE